MRSKISLPSSDIPVELTDSEYSYVEYVCKLTWRNSDEFFRHLIRSFRADGIPSYDEWIKLQSAGPGEKAVTDTPFAVVTTPIAPSPVAAAADRPTPTDNGATNPIASEPVMAEPAAVETIAPASEPVVKPAATTTRPLRDPSQSRSRTSARSTAIAKAQPEEEAPKRKGRPSKGSTKARDLTEKARRGAKSKQAGGTNS